MIFFTQFVVHILYQIPDTTDLSKELLETFASKQAQAQNFSSICFAFFNLICFIIAIPIAKLAEARGTKKVHAASLLIMAFAYLLMTYMQTPVVVISAMGLAGIGWASTLALPFAMLSKYIKEGTEGSAMGIFNIFISAPQVLVCTVIAWFINISTYKMQTGYMNNHWEYAFLIGAIMLILSAVVTLTIKEEK
jgi:maltose/moltooligosaccharide transporter